MAWVVTGLKAFQFCPTSLKTTPFSPSIFRVAAKVRGNLRRMGSGKSKTFKPSSCIFTRPKTSGNLSFGAEAWALLLHSSSITQWHKSKQKLPVLSKITKINKKLSACLLYINA
jgi:hypothetical protein